MLALWQAIREGLLANVTNDVERDLAIEKSSKQLSLLLRIGPRSPEP
jgi:hypothetical protein